MNGLSSSNIVASKLGLPCVVRNIDAKGNIENTTVEVSGIPDDAKSFLKNLNRSENCNGILCLMSQQRVPEKLKVNKNTKVNSTCFLVPTPTGVKFISNSIDAIYSLLAPAVNVQM